MRLFLKSVRANEGPKRWPAIRGPKIEESWGDAFEFRWSLDRGHF